MYSVQVPPCTQLIKFFNTAEKQTTLKRAFVFTVQDALYVRYNTLPPHRTVVCQVLCLANKMVFSPHLLPSIFCNYFTLNTSIHSYSTRHNKLYLSQVNSQFGHRLLKFKGSQLWTRLPNDLIDITSFESFKKGLKLFLFCDPL